MPAFDFAVNQIKVKKVSNHSHITKCVSLSFHPVVFLTCKHCYFCVLHMIFSIPI